MNRYEHFTSQVRKMFNLGEGEMPTIQQGAEYLRQAEMLMTKELREKAA